MVSEALALEPLGDLTDWPDWLASTKVGAESGASTAMHVVATEWGLTIEHLATRAARLGPAASKAHRIASMAAVMGYPSLVHRAHTFEQLTERAKDGFHADLDVWLKFDPRRWCTPDEIQTLLAVMRQLVRDAAYRLGQVEAHLAETQDRIAHMERQIGARPPLRPNLGVTPWAECVEMQFAALNSLDVIARHFDTKEGGWSPPSLAWRSYAGNIKDDDLSINWRHDISALKIAQAYCWMDPALQAVRQAALSVPTDAPLTYDQLPKGNGQAWWWFSPPLPIQTHSASDEVAGLLWSLSTPDSPRARELASDSVVTAAAEADILRSTHLTFSAYTLSELQGGVVPIPSTMWLWRFGESLDAMLLRCGADYDASYGPGGKWEHDAERPGKEHTLAAICALSLLFLAAIVWIEQEIVLVRPEHIERHRRKAFVREHKLGQEPQLRVVALRQAHYDRPADGTPGEHEARKYDNWQWVVSGHWRQQPCGPGRAGRKLTFIHPFIKGPAGKPLKASQRVFAVVR